MALIINGERVEDGFIEQVRRQLADQHGSGNGIPEWEALGKDIETFARDMVIAQVLIRQEAAANGPSVPSKDIDQEMKRIRRSTSRRKRTRTPARSRHHRKAGAGGHRAAEDRSLLDDVCKDVIGPTEA